MYPGTLSLGTLEDVKAETERVCEAEFNIIGPECVVPVRKPNVNLIAITETVLEYSREQAAKEAVVG